MELYLFTDGATAMSYLIWSAAAVGACTVVYLSIVGVLVHIGFWMR
jgi:hypothetical protein